MATKTYIVLVTTPIDQGDADSIIQEGAKNIAEQIGLDGGYAPTLVIAQRVGQNGEILTLASYDMKD